MGQVGQTTPRRAGETRTDQGDQWRDVGISVTAAVPARRDDDGATSPGGMSRTSCMMRLDAHCSIVGAERRLKAALLVVIPPKRHRQLRGDRET